MRLLCVCRQQHSTVMSHFKSTAAKSHQIHNKCSAITLNAPSPCQLRKTTLLLQTLEVVFAMIYLGDIYTLFVYKVNNTSYPKKVALLSKPYQTGIAVSGKKTKKQRSLDYGTALHIRVWGGFAYHLHTKVDFSIWIV